MPGLESFCVCTAIGLGSIYLLQVSWFVPWMSLDEDRVAEGRDGLIPCIVHKTSQGSDKKENSLVMKGYATLLSSIVFKVITVIVTIGFLVFGIWGWTEMRQSCSCLLIAT